MVDVSRRFREEEIPFREKVPGESLTTFGSGGEIDYLLLPRNAAELRFGVEILQEEGIPYRVIGRGSNLLLPDEGYIGALIRLSKLDVVERKGRSLRVGAGVKMPLLSRMARDFSLSGLEFASGIPGEAGGALSCNAGAFGESMSDLIEEVTLLRDGRIECLSASDLDMRDHEGRLPQGGIVLSVLLRMTEGDRDRIDAVTAEMKRRRKASQPDFPSAGSVFRRTKEGVPAARLIEETGLKGRRIGGAMLSEKHCNFIVNVGGATTEEYFRLGETVREEVKKRSGVTLEYEVERVVCSRTRN